MNLVQYNVQAALSCVISWLVIREDDDFSQLLTRINRLSG